MGRGGGGAGKSWSFVPGDGLEQTCNQNKGFERELDRMELSSVFRPEPGQFLGQVREGVKQTEKAYLHQYSLGNKDVSWLDTKNSAVKGRANQSTEVLFIEQCHNFLAENGFLAVVIPDGILTNSSLHINDNIVVCNFV